MRIFPACLLSAVFLAAAAAPAFAQAAGQTPYAPPRLADGRPDLQGVWTNVSLTTLERSGRGSGTTVTAEEAAAREKATVANIARAAQKTNPDEGAPKGGNIGGYNAFWIDSGTRLGVINGQARTAWIVDPADGRIPYSPQGRKEFEKLHSAADADFDGPESRTPADRCIVGFGSTGGPPMLNVMYNNNYQIVQTPDYVMILVEMNHDARIIPLKRKHGPSAITGWMGDSVGRWEGDTLVVETVGIDARNVLRPTGAYSMYLGKNPKITERFSRTGPDEVLYEFEVHEPSAFTKSWKAQIPMLRTKGAIYEYACHEGNYALPGMLAGARLYEERGKSNKLNYYAKDPR
jgi:hypothetical protein